MRPRHARSGRRPAALAVAPWDSPQWCPRASHSVPRCSLPMSRESCTGRRRRHTRTPAALAPLRSLAGAGRRGHEHRRPRARRGGPWRRPSPCPWRRPCPRPCPFLALDHVGHCLRCCRVGGLGLMPPSLEGPPVSTPRVPGCPCIGGLALVVVALGGVLVLVRGGVLVLALALFSCARSRRPLPSLPPCGRPRPHAA